MASDTFKLVTPNMSGGGISAFQESLNETLQRWEIPKRIDVDDQYGPITDRVARHVCHGLGLGAKSYRDGMTPPVRMKVRDPSKRTPVEVTRFDHLKDWRDAWRKRVASLASATAGAGAGPAAAIAYGRAQLGVSESPPGSNRGPKIDAWNRAVGTPPGPNAFWCGAFVNACLHAAGLPNQQFLRYCPTIVTRAKGASGGWAWHDRLGDGRPGDLVLYTESSQPGVAAHVELVVTASPFDVIGGNTSATPGSGSQTNGGCVAEHKRDPNDPALRFMGYARPPWTS